MWKATMWKGYVIYSEFKKKSAERVINRSFDFIALSLCVLLLFICRIRVRVCLHAHVAANH